MPSAKSIKSTSNKNTSKARAPAPAPAPVLPDWPAFDLFTAQEDLSLHDLREGQIVTIHNFWPSKLCGKYVSFLSSLPLITTPGTPKKGEAVRVNDRYQVNDPAFADKLWNQTGLKDIISRACSEGADTEKNDVQRQQEMWGGEVLGLNPNIRIYRYRKGQFFDQHYDDSNSLLFPSQPPTLARTTWTLLLYLTSPATGCHGGETVFYPDPPTKSKKGNMLDTQPIVVGLETGMALLHRHGAECMIHEGREVTAGEKWVIRSDLCVRR